MSTKKSTLKKKKKKEEKEEESLSLEEQNLFLSRQVEALKLQLVKSSNKTHVGETVVRELRHKLGELQKDYDEEKKRTFALACDMTRQYKSMREELLKKLSNSDAVILSLRDELAALQLAKDESERKYLQKIAMKEAEILEQKNKMDEMAHEFGQMLKQTLDKMSEKIEITNDWEQDAKEEPLVRTFEDFNLGLAQ